MKTATFIKNLKGFQGEARLYKLSEPIEYDYDWEAEKNTKKTEFVVVSAISAAFDTSRPETYIFPADESGEVLDWSELEGSYRGGTNHTRALKKGGWEVVDGVV
ncbi:MAG: hypothetical protein M0R06_01350 [Sphaerochaeta sp.]|jgi:hypothetical protein|nr:hypothetical protein [Sphaerochaeta sp.]